MALENTSRTKENIVAAASYVSGCNNICLSTQPVDNYLSLGIIYHLIQTLLANILSGQAMIVGVFWDSKLPTFYVVMQNDHS